MKLSHPSLLFGVFASFALVAAFSCTGGEGEPVGNGGDSGGSGQDTGGQHDTGVALDAGGKPDAGQDAGMTDAGQEAGFDAGADSGSPDTGPVDGGADSGSPDTGIVISCGPSISGKGGEMCNVSAGPFMMGCNKAVDTECSNDESPYHSVNVPGFKIDKYEVTTGEYQACVDAGGCTAANTGGSCNYGVSGLDGHPINCVDWNQATAYCAWAGKRLPTEAEWEKAARGTDGRKYPWGNGSLDCDHAVWNGSTCGNSGTAPVGSKPAGVSPYGAEDMVGNVWEWVEDWYHDTYAGAPTDGSAWVTPTGWYRVLRGGSWDYASSGYLRVSSRFYVPTSRVGGVGFRCASAQ